MRTLYFGHDELLESRFPDLRPVADTRLTAALSSFYRLYESEYAGKFYLIFDYSPTLPAQQEARDGLAPEILARTFAAVEFDRPEDRAREVAAVRRSLWDDGGDDSAGIVAGLPPSPPCRAGTNARVLGDDRPGDRS